MIEYVAGFAFGGENNEKVILIQKNKPEWQKGKLNAVGGKVEQGENAHDAMVREFKEETNLHVPVWEHFATLQGNDWKVVFFRSFGVDVDRAETPTDEAVYIFYSSNTKSAMLLPNLKWLIPLALDLEPKLPTYFYYGAPGKKTTPPKPQRHPNSECDCTIMMCHHQR